jgi:hypothetical protein
MRVAPAPAAAASSIAFWAPRGARLAPVRPTPARVLGEGGGVMRGEWGARGWGDGWMEGGGGALSKAKREGPN